MQLRKRYLRSITALLMMLSMIFALPMQAVAVDGKAGEKCILIEDENGTVPFSVREINGIWCADVYSLASMANCLVSVNESNNILSIYRPDSRVILYSVSNDKYEIINGKTYVPFQECSIRLGLRFQQYVWKNGFYVTAMKTPADMQKVLNDIFSRNCYHLWEVPAELGMTWAEAEFFARMWALMPFVGSGSLIGTVTGQDEQDRYDRAIASVLASSGNFLDLIYTWSDMDKSLKDVGKKLSTADEVIDTIWGWIDDNEMLCKQLKDAGIYETIREMFRTGSNPYEEDIGDFLKGYPSVANAMNIDYWLETFAFYGMAVDGDEAMLLAMKKAFGNSPNEYLRRSTEKLFDSQFGTGRVAISDIYGGYIFDFLFSQMTDEFEDALYGGEMSLVGKFAAMGITELLEMTYSSPSINGISDAMIYYSIYNTIAMELSDYYYNHRYDETEHIGADLRAIAIMYLNTARACVNECKFDSSLDDATTNMDKVIDADLIALLEFADQEYDPTFTNVEILNYLETLPDQPQSGINNNTQDLDKDEIFDETFWFFSFGQTLGSNFDALFHKNGTFSARSYGSGDYDDGTYTYQNGILTINFWFTGNGCAFEGDATGFVSREKYEMQVGEDYYTISPIPGGSSFYFETPPTPAPTPAPTPIPTPKVTSAPSATMDTLPDGEYYGFLSSWSRESMTVELLNYEGRHEMSFNYMLAPTGQYYTLGISKATVWLEYAWSENYVETQCNSIDAALNTEVWEGVTLREACTMEISFTVSNSQVTKIVFLYAA